MNAHLLHKLDETVKNMLNMKLIGLYVQHSGRQFEMNIILIYDLTNKQFHLPEMSFLINKVGKSSFFQVSFSRGVLGLQLRL